jgi:hypothetical protein
MITSCGCGDTQNFPPSSPELSPMDFYMWWYMEEAVYQRIFKAYYTLLHCILDIAAHIMDNSKELMWATCVIHRQAERCIEAECVYFEQLLPQINE